jgi:Ala-tRNA(Pro) deacylase
MATPPTIESFLTGHRVPFEVIEHEHSSTSLEAAHSAHIPPQRLAKGVLIEDGEHYLMAVVPSSCHVHLGEISRLLGRHIALASESDAGEVFPDCARGAVPALGPAYGLETVWDERLRDTSEVYFEAGDHEHLVRVSTRDFLGLLDGCVHGSITTPA